MFERNLYDLCGELKKELELEQSFFKIRGKSKIESIKIYFHKQAEIPQSDVMEEKWSTLLSLNSIRNNIVHNYGKYEEQNSWVDKFLKRNEDIIISEDYKEFMMNRKFLIELIPFFISFCHELQAALKIRKLKI